jgi:hypothetical protein
VERYAGRPFVLLGVNSDENREEPKQLAKDGTVTWRSWWDGSQEGPIHQRWKIQRWPSIFLIDAKGVIRKGPTLQSVEDLDATIEKLVQEAEKQPVS